MSARYFEEAAHAAAYAKFRPKTPPALTARIISFLKEKYKLPLYAAADVGCGSGQSTRTLAPYFDKVTGLDISSAQIEEAIGNETSKNITYKVSPAETLPFENESLQLVTAGQACHWFDLPKFYKEVDRILVPNGVLAVFGYHFPRPCWKDKDDQLLKELERIYKQTGGYWGKERKLVDDLYTDEKFNLPFADRLRDDSCVDESKGSVKDFQGYVTSWSGYQKYKLVKGDAAAQKLLDDFVANIMEILEVKSTPEETELTFRIPYFLLMGRKPS